MNTFDITLANNNIDGSLIQTVNGRQIHAALEVGQDYTNWAKNQISRAGLTEDRDFTKVANISELSKTGQTRTNYHFTVEAGKKIAMMSSSLKGNQVRDYFIACEHNALAKKPLTLSLPQDYIQALEHLLITKKSEVLALQHVEALKVVVAEQAPKVEALNRIATATKGSLCIRDAAKNLQVQEKHLKNYLFENKWVYNREGTSGNTNPLAYSSKILSGLLEHKIVSPLSHATTQVRVTATGLTKLALAFEGV